MTLRLLSTQRALKASKFRKFESCWDEGSLKASRTGFQGASVENWMQRISAVDGFRIQHGSTNSRAYLRSLSSAPSRKSILSRAAQPNHGVRLTTRGATQKGDPAATDRKIASCHCVIHLLIFVLCFWDEFGTNNLEAFQCSLPRLVYLRFFNRWTLKLSVHISPSAKAYFPCPKQSDRDRTTRTGTLNETSQTSVEFRGGQPIDGSK